MSYLWYSLVLFGTIAAAFLLYALVMGWCKFSQQSSRQRLADLVDQNNSVSLNLQPYLASTFKYKKGIENSEIPSETECTVCLSDFQDDENIRQLSHCRHSFHAPCIDMWLYSHSDCPLCRTPIHRLDSDDRASTIENSREGLLDIRISSRASSSDFSSNH